MYIHIQSSQVNDWIMDLLVGQSATMESTGQTVRQALHIEQPCSPTKRLTHKMSWTCCFTLNALRWITCLHVFFLLVPPHLVLCSAMTLRFIVLRKRPRFRSSLLKKQRTGRADAPTLSLRSRGWEQETESDWTNMTHQITTRRKNPWPRAPVWRVYPARRGSRKELII